MYSMQSLPPSLSLSVSPLPQGVMISHDNLTWTASVCCHMYQLTEASQGSRDSHQSHVIIMFLSCDNYVQCIPAFKCMYMNNHVEEYTTHLG